MSEESVWPLGYATCLIHISVLRLTRRQRDSHGRSAMETELGRSWETSVAEMTRSCYCRAPGLYVWGSEVTGSVLVGGECTRLHGLYLGLVGAMKTILMLCKWLPTFLLMLKRCFLGLPLRKWWEWWSGHWLGPEREEDKGTRGRRDVIFMKLKMSLHILQEICTPLPNVTHHLKPASITHAHRSVWPFVTFPFGVVCIFFFC